MSIDAPATRNWGRLATVLAIVSTLLATLAVLAILDRKGILGTGIVSRLFYGDGFPDSLFPVTISDETFIVSGKTLRRVQRDDAGAVQQIELALPLPSDATALIVDDNTSGEYHVSDTVFVSIQKRDVLADSAERLERVYPRYLADDEPRRLFGLEARAFAEDSPYSGQELLTVASQDSNDFALRCDTPRVDNMPSICRRQLLVQEGFVVIYRYHRDHLSDWNEIETMVSEFFDGLRAPQD